MTYVSVYFATWGLLYLAMFAFAVFVWTVRLLRGETAKAQSFDVVKWAVSCALVALPMATGIYYALDLLEVCRR